MCAYALCLPTPKHLACLYSDIQSPRSSPLITQREYHPVERTVKGLVEDFFEFWGDCNLNLRVLFKRSPSR